MRLEPLSGRDSGPAGTIAAFALEPKDPVFRGFQTHLENYRGNHWRFSKAGTRPALTPVQPSFGDLDTGRSGTPLLYTGTHTAHSDESQNAFGNPGTGRPGIPFFTPGLIPLTATSSKTLLGTLIQAGQEFPSLHQDSYRSQRRAPNAFGNPDTGRSGIPFFTPRLIPLTATGPDAFGDPGTGRPGLPFFTPRLIPLTATSPTAVPGAAVQAGRRFPLLFLPQIDRQSPAPVHLRPGPLAVQRTRRQQRQQQPLVTQAHTPVGVLAGHLQVAVLRLALGVEQQRHRAVDLLAMHLGLGTEPDHHTFGHHLDLLQNQGLGRGQATDHHPDHQADNRQRSQHPRQ